MAKRRVNNTGSVFYRKDRKLWIGEHRYNINGKTICKSCSAKTQKECQRELNKIIAEAEASSSLSGNFATIENFAKYWLYNVKKRELKENSFDRLESTTNRYVINELGPYFLAEVTTGQIQCVLNDIDKSFSTIKKAYRAYTALFDYAIKTHRLNINPCDALVLPRAKANMVEKEIKVFTLDEVEKFRNVALSKYRNGKYVYKLGLLFMIVLNTGLRRGELLALNWSDVDFKNKTLNINKTLERVKDRDNPHTYKSVITSPKTKKSSRLLHFNDKTLSYFNEYKKIVKEFGVYEKNKPLAITKNGERLNERNLSRSFYDILRRAGIEQCGIHTLRHTFASLCFNEGKSIVEVSHLMGHSSTSVTQNTYLHIIRKNEKDFTSTLNF